MGFNPIKDTQLTSLKLTAQHGSSAGRSPVLFFADPQTIAMGDAEVALSMTEGATNQVDSNVLFVDPESGGASEDLLLPPEADCPGLMLIIVNTGGESIVVKEDGDSTTIVTIATTEAGLVVCDGTSWKGFVGATT